MKIKMLALTTVLIAALWLSILESLPVPKYVYGDPVKLYGFWQRCTGHIVAQWTGFPVKYKIRLKCPGSDQFDTDWIQESEIISNEPEVTKEEWEN